jgi:hypothetical protein
MAIGFCYFTHKKSKFATQNSEIKTFNISFQHEIIEERQLLR